MRRRNVIDADDWRVANAPPDRDQTRRERRLAAVMAADMAGFSRMMQTDEIGAYSLVRARHRELFVPAVRDHGGRIVKLMGDGALVEFPSVVNAVDCAVAVQTAFAARNEQGPPAEQVTLRIGINVGDLIIEDDDIYGDGVNIAARLQEIAEPGEVVLSATAHEHAASRVGMRFRDGGAQALKNIAQPVRVFRWGEGDGAEVKSLPLPEKPSIAVLPFQNMSGDPEQEYFADGVVESITAALSRIRSFFVIARNSAFVYKGRHINVVRIGR